MLKPNNFSLNIVLSPEQFAEIKRQIQIKGECVFRLGKDERFEILSARPGIILPEFDVVHGLTGQALLK